jgi:hypothetical protein
MALGPTWPLTEMSNINISVGGKRGPDREANNLAVMWADSVENVGASTSHNPMGLHGLLKEISTVGKPNISPPYKQIAVSSLQNYASLSVTFLLATSSQDN